MTAPDSAPDADMGNFKDVNGLSEHCGLLWVHIAVIVTSPSVRECHIARTPHAVLRQRALTEYEDSAGVGQVRRLCSRTVRLQCSAARPPCFEICLRPRSQPASLSAFIQMTVTQDRPMTYAKMRGLVSFFSGEVQITGVFFLLLFFCWTVNKL